MLKLYKLTRKQREMWDEVYTDGYVELLSQRDRRTAFTLQSKFGSDQVRIEDFGNEDQEYIFFTNEFAREIGATPRLIY